MCRNKKKINVKSCKWGFSFLVPYDKVTTQYTLGAFLVRSCLC